MRAYLINERFTEKSDPTHDMNIGGFKLDDVYSHIDGEASNKWIKFLKDNLEGKIVKGTMMKWDQGHNWKTYTIYIKKVMNTKEKDGFNQEVYVQDKDEILYTIHGGEKLYVK